MNESYKRNFIHAGRLAGQVRAFGKDLIKSGVSYNEVIAKIREKINQLGAIPAFPPQIALNDVAAHFLPDPDQDLIFSNEVIKLDVGICYQGAIGDCAVTVDLSGKHQHLIDAAEAALLAAEQSLHVGQPIREIGGIIESTIGSFGLKPVKNLSGHGLGQYRVHTSPTIPNYLDKSTAFIKPGMTFAIEPFATNGKGLIYDAGNPTIFSFNRECRLKTELAKSILKKIQALPTLPFAIHDLIDQELPLVKVKAALSELLKSGAIEGYAPLIDEAHGMVAQAENSVLVDENGMVFITTR